MLSRPSRIGALFGVLAGLYFAVGQLQEPITGIQPSGEIVHLDEDPEQKARRILKKFDAELDKERATHEAPTLGTTLNPKAFEKRTTEMVRLDQLGRTWEPDEKLSREVARLVWDGIWKRVVDIDRRHTQELKRWVRRNEWPRLSTFGKKAMRNAWLLAQHADQQRSFQKTVLRQMIQRARAGEIELWQPAFLWDRIAVGEDRLQVFATQGRCVAPGAWEAWPFVEPSKVDARRARVGLEPYVEYRERASKLCENFGRL